MSSVVPTTSYFPGEDLFIPASFEELPDCGLEPPSSRPFLCWTWRGSITCYKWVLHAPFFNQDPWGSLMSYRRSITEYAALFMSRKAEDILLCLRVNFSSWGFETSLLSEVALIQDGQSLTYVSYAHLCHQILYQLQVRMGSGSSQGHLYLQTTTFEMRIKTKTEALSCPAYSNYEQYY